MPTEAKKLVTPEEYLAIERKTENYNEYIDGLIVARPLSCRDHAVICSNLIGGIANALDGKDYDVMNCGMRLKVSNGVYCYADVVVFDGSYLAEDYHDDIAINPTLIIEVLGDEPSKNDSTSMLCHYFQTRSVEEIVHVCQGSPLVQQFARQADGSWQSKFFSGIDAVIEFASIPAKVSLATVYNRIIFPERE